MQRKKRKNMRLVAKLAPWIGNTVLTVSVKGRVWAGAAVGIQLQQTKLWPVVLPGLNRRALPSFLLVLWLDMECGSMDGRLLLYFCGVACCGGHRQRCLCCKIQSSATT
jgi:hypothetical protein